MIFLGSYKQETNFKFNKNYIILKTIYIYNIYVC